MSTKSVKQTNSNAIPWNDDTFYALNFFRIIAKILGIWPLDKRHIILYIQVLIITIIQLSMSLSLITSFWTQGNCGDITDVTDILTMITSGILSTLNVLVPNIYHYEMYSIVNVIIEDWSKVNDEKSRRIMIKYAYIGRIVFITMMSGVYFVGTPYIIFRLPFVVDLINHYNNVNASVYGVPLGPTCWVSTDISTVQYAVDYTLKSIQLFSTCTIAIFNDTYFFAIAMHICGQLELLRSTFECFHEINYEIEQRLFLSKFIKRHQYLILVTKNFDCVYNFIIFGQIMGGTVYLCITTLGLITSLSLGNKMVAMLLIIRIYISYTQLFIYCYVGEQLNIQCKQLQTALYNCNWYNMSKKTAFDVKFIIMRMNYPFNLTAGGVYYMNHENFKNILKAMGSYFSVLRLMFVK